jgi:hypothetical protein
MAIALEFLDFVVPIDVIRAKYPGGWEQCLRDHQSLIGGRVWYDEHLFRDGAMNPMDIRSLVERWTELGFVPMVSRDGKTVWNDVCVVEWMFGGPTIPCDWLALGPHGPSAYLRGTAPGPVISRENFEYRES